MRWRRRFRSSRETHHRAAAQRDYRGHRHGLIAQQVIRAKERVQKRAARGAFGGCGRIGKRFRGHRDVDEAPRVDFDVSWV